MRFTITFYLDCGFILCDDESFFTVDALDGTIFVYAPVSASTMARDVPILGWLKRKTYSRFPPSLWSFSDLIFASGTFASTILRAESAETLGAG